MKTDQWIEIARRGRNQEILISIQALKNGDCVEVDANKGIVRKLGRG